MPLNKQLLADVVNQIVSQPETHSQEEWHCGTSHCFAGWTQVLGRGPTGRYPSNVADDAADLLGLTPDDARYLFSAERTTPEIHRCASELINGDSRGKYDKRGYDRDGYNLDGIDRYGRDQNGIDCREYGLDGYDLGGYGRDGYNRDDRDRRGYGRDGRDSHDNSLPLIVVTSP